MSAVHDIVTVAPALVRNHLVHHIAVAVVPYKLSYAGDGVCNIRYQN